MKIYLPIGLLFTSVSNLIKAWSLPLLSVIKNMKKSVEIKSGSVMAVSIVLHDFNISQIESALLGVTGGDKEFFNGELAIIDATDSEANTFIDWFSIVEIVRKFGLVVVGVRNAPQSHVQSIIGCGLTIVESVGRDRAPLSSPSVVPSIPQVGSRLAPMIIDTPVRAGQRIYAKNTDLIVMAVVNNGAEIIADGNIHVYAELKGRALAGASGDTQSRIFAQRMEPELVSIAGVYRTFENGFPANWANKTAQVKLEKDVIFIDPLQ